MARRLGAITVQLRGVSAVPPDTRRIGALKNADPCSDIFARQIHESCYDKGDLQSPHTSYAYAKDGINTVNSRMLRWHDPLWNKFHPDANAKDKDY